jgi:membrane-associated PAP2 superfamily phosphatase
MYYALSDNLQHHQCWRVNRANRNFARAIEHFALMNRPVLPRFALLGPVEALVEGGLGSFVRPVRGHRERHGAAGRESVGFLQPPNSGIA